jgi:hypothetical protein
VATRDDLETALAERWDDDNLAVYGDHLQGESDPRGELIAIDLAIDRALGGRDAATGEPLLRDTSAATFAIDKRRQHVAAWLGEPLASQLSHHGSSRFGFIDLKVDDHAAERFFRDLVASPARAYLRRLRVIGLDHISPVLEVLAAAPDPWLQELVVFQLPGAAHPVEVSTALGRRVIAATPRLASMHLRGRSLLDEFPHPGLRSLSIQGYDALGSLHGEGPALPALERLDFAFFDDAGVRRRRPIPAEELAALLPGARLPALRALDLSRNEPSGPGVLPRGAFNYGGTIDPFRFVRELPLLDQLTRLAMPAVRTREQEQQLAAALARMPALERLAIPHGYRSLAPPSELHHPAAAIDVARPWPWPPIDRLLGRDRIQFADGPPLGLDPSLVTLAIELEAAWDRLDAAERARWEAFWDAFAPLFEGARAGMGMVSTRTIVDAFATLPGRRYIPGWTEVHGELRAEHRAVRIAVSLAPG